MRKLFVSLSLLALPLLTFNAEAVPACFSTSESFALTPSSSGATFNGQKLNALPSGRYTTDGGVELYLSQAADVSAVLDAQAACMAPAKQLTMHFTDPWTGALISLTVGDAP